MFFGKHEVKDERIMHERYRIGNEGFYLLYGLLIASTLVKSLFYQMPLEAYWTEFAIFLIGGIYVTVRHVMTGTFTISFKGDKGNRRKGLYFLIISVFFSGLAGVAVGIRNYFLYDFSFYMIGFVILPMVLFLTPILFFLLLFLERGAVRRSEKILSAEEDDQDDQDDD